MPADPLSEYLSKIRDSLAAGDATEHTHRPAVADLLQSLEPGVQTINEPKHRTDCGAPDIRVRKGELTTGYIECKDIGLSLDEAERTEQLRRYLKHLPNLVLTDYLEFRWYVDGKARRMARLGRLSPEGKLSRDKAGAESARELLLSFLAHTPEPIAKPKDLAERMARLTHAIRDIIVEAFDRGAASATLGELHQAFEKTLVPELKVADFADMFAQTLAYGLFAARCNHKGPEPFKRLGAAAEIPKTNPFLRQLFDTMTGLPLNDEPFVGFVDDLVEVLAHADMGAILRDFGKRTRKEDPIVHFYETFLAAYDPKMRKVRGVYYTPEPVISYIVRSVDHLLKTRFGLPDGLADRATVEYEWQEGAVTQPRTLKGRAPRVLILDPACGTGGFLYAIVDHIREEFRGRGDAGMWSGYVKQHLLPRLFGFELLMAPYAVAHLKLGMQLAAQDLPEAQRGEWAYDFSSDERLGIYLTNTLERAERQIQALWGPLRIITEEANAAAEIKRQRPIMVVLGNPPYAGHSANRSWEILKEPKRETRIIRGRPRTFLVKAVPTFIGALLRDYYQVDGQPLGERNPKWLQDDYVKFIRFGQWRIEQTGAGILAFITNHGYLDNPTFRGMRQQLMETFTDIYILDLHGNTKKKERCPDGSKDENVFDIQQGVAIGIFVKERGKRGPATVHHADVWGLRTAAGQGGSKYAWLSQQELASTDWTASVPRPPFYLLKPSQGDRLGEYQQGHSVVDILPVHASTVTTARNDFAVAFDPAVLAQRVKDLRNPSADDEALRVRYRLRDVSYWTLRRAREQLSSLTDISAHIRPYCYRPFDFRWVFYHDAICERPRLEVMMHMLNPNVALLTHRPQSPGDFTFAYCTTLIGDQCVAANKTVGGGNSFQFPLYVYPPDQGNHVGHDSLRLSRQPNLSQEFVNRLADGMGVAFVPDGRGDLEKTFGPEDVFHYIYAVLHSPTYRQRYAEFLKTDFPRVPLTSNLDLFRALVAKGADLVALHIMEDDYPAASWTLAGHPSPLASLPTRFPVPGDNLVDKGYPRYFPPGHNLAGEAEPLAAGRVYINAEELKTGKRGQYFEGVPPEVWGFHVGGYQVCEKWLKDRRGRRLSYDDLTHYQRIVVALRETIRLMAEIDEAIPGWPLE